MTVMWKRGRRLSSTAGVLMILTSLAHTAGSLSPPQGDAETKVIAEMSAFHIPLGLGMNPSMFDCVRSLMFTMSITFLALGVLTLAVTASADVPGRFLRRIAWINALWVGAFCLLNWVYRIPPPLICGIAIELAIFLSLLLPPTRAEKFTA